MMLLLDVPDVPDWLLLLPGGSFLLLGEGGLPDIALCTSADDEVVLDGAHVKIYVDGVAGVVDEKGDEEVCQPKMKISSPSSARGNTKPPPWSSVGWHRVR